MSVASTAQVLMRSAKQTLQFMGLLEKNRAAGQIVRPATGFLGRLWRNRAPVMTAGISMTAYATSAGFFDTMQQGAQAYWGADEATSRFGDIRNARALTLMPAIGAGLYMGARALLGTGSRASVARNVYGPAGTVGRGEGALRRRKWVRMAKLSPYVAATALGAWAGGTMAPHRVGEGRILSMGREPATSRLNYRTAGIGMR